MKCFTQDLTHSKCSINISVAAAAIAKATVTHTSMVTALSLMNYVCSWKKKKKGGSKESWLKAHLWIQTAYIKILAQQFWAV